MASRQYICPIRLFNYCDISTGNDFNLPRVMKQLQAEFRIAEGGFIEVDGYTYTRHDVFEELEQPDFKKRLEFHKEIWNAPPLLNLLEDNSIDFITVRDGFRGFWNDADFDEFFSPYFVGPFEYVSRNLLSSGRLEEMGELLVFEDFLQAPEREEAFRPMRIFLDENLRLLRNTTADNYKIMRPKIEHWIDEEWAAFFNNLPHEFYDIKQDITVFLINLGVAIQKSFRKDCRKMSEQLVAVTDVPEHLRQTILSNHSAYYSSKSTNYRGYFWIGWVLIAFIRGMAGGCSDSNDNSTYLEKSQIYTVELDSTAQKIKDSMNAAHVDTSVFRNLRNQQLR